MALYLCWIALTALTIAADRQIREKQAKERGVVDFSASSLTGYIALSLITPFIILPIYFYSSRKVMGGNRWLAMVAGFAITVAEFIVSVVWPHLRGHESSFVIDKAWMWRLTARPMQNRGPNQQPTARVNVCCRPRYTCVVALLIPTVRRPTSSRMPSVSTPDEPEWREGNRQRTVSRDVSSVTGTLIVGGAALGSSLDSTDANRPFVHSVDAVQRRVRWLLVPLALIPGRSSIVEACSRVHVERRASGYPNDCDFRSWRCRRRRGRAIHQRIVGGWATFDPRWPFVVAAVSTAFVLFDRHATQDAWWRAGFLGAVGHCPPRSLSPVRFWQR
jgi:hypothetical protein